MNKKIADTLKTTLGLVVIILAARLPAPFPWWGFVLPVFLWGIFVRSRGWDFPAFLTGFITGFLIWILANLYFDMRSGGIVLDKIALLFSIPKPLLLCVPGLIGGLLTGLALYTGNGLFTFTK